MHYVVRPDHAPEVGAAIIASAVAEVARATGLTFVDDGLTDEAPSVGRAADSGARHPRVLIAWSTEQETPALAGPVEGEGGSIWFEDHGPGSLTRPWPGPGRQDEHPPAYGTMAA